MIVKVVRDTLASAFNRRQSWSRFKAVEYWKAHQSSSLLPINADLIVDSAKSIHSANVDTAFCESLRHYSYFIMDSPIFWRKNFEYQNVC